MTDSNQVTVLLIGKTGNGKSATGNSILRRKAFNSQYSTLPVTATLDCEVSEFNGRIIKVVDGPGVGKNRLDIEASVKFLMTTLETAIAANPRGFHAFLLVVRFGSRFTVEDQDTIDILKKIFGDDFVKNFCILLFTCGDMFEHEFEETGTSFRQWCNDQDRMIQYLLKECDNRVVLFDNVTKDPAKKNKQIENLLHVADLLRSKGKIYNEENFERARESRDRIIAELNR